VVYFGVLGYFVAGTIAGFINLKSGENRVESREHRA
jgi:hypothetical protein